MTYLEGFISVISVTQSYHRQDHKQRFLNSPVYSTSPYKVISHHILIKRMRTHATGAEKTGANAEVTKTSIAINLKDAYIAWHK